MKPTFHSGNRLVEVLNLAVGMAPQVVKNCGQTDHARPEVRKADHVFHILPTGERLAPGPNSRAGIAPKETDVHHPRYLRPPFRPEMAGLFQKCREVTGNVIRRRCVKMRIEAPDKVSIWKLLKSGDLALDFPRVNEVIRIQVVNELAGGPRNPGVASLRRTSLRQQQVSHRQ